MKRVLLYFILVALAVCLAAYFLWLPKTPAQFTGPSAGGGTSDSVAVDTTGNADWGFVYPSYLRKGSNITLSIQDDTLTIAGPAGSGTADSIAVDTDGDGTIDNYIYSTSGAIGMIRKGDNVTLTVDTDTIYFNADNVAVSDSSAAFADSTDQITHGNIKDWHIDFGTGTGQVSTDDVTEGSSNLYDQPLPDSSNWSTAYSWGDHSGQNYLDDDVGQDVDGDDIDSTDEDFVFNDAYRVTSAEPDSQFMTKAYIDAAGGGLTPQSVKGDHVDSTSEDFVFNDAYRITSEQAESILVTKGYVDASDDTVDTYREAIGDTIADHWTAFTTDNNDYPGDSVSTIYGMLSDTTWDMKNGFVWSGAHEFTGGTPSLEIPNASAPATDAEGEIAWDSNDDAIEVYSGDESESVLLPMYYDIEAMVFAPDGVNDYIPIFHADALLYPHGIEIDQLSITLPTSTDYTLPIHEVGSDHAFDARIDSLVVSSAQYLEDGSPMDGNLDADDYIYLNVPSTDVDWIFVKIIYHVTQGD